MSIELMLTVAAVGGIVLTLAALERTSDARRKVKVRDDRDRRNR